MCRASFPIPTLVAQPKAIGFYAAGVKQLTTTTKGNKPFQVSEHRPKKPQHESTISVPASKTLPSILRKSSHAVQSSLKRAKRYNSVPGLVAAEDDNESTVSRESSVSSIKSEESSNCGTDAFSEEEEVDPSFTVTFDDKVLVQEFRRFPGEAEATWYTRMEMRAFMLKVVELIQDYERSRYWGGGYFSWTSHRHHVLHSHPALAVPDDEDEGPTMQNEIKNILLVDSHDLSLKLFKKSFQSVFPHATIVTAKRSQDALAFCQEDGASYDIILVEERLSLFRQADSGSSFLEILQQSRCQHNSLKIGVSLHLERDQARMMESGADFCWSKPPPPLNKATVDEIFQTLLVKRGKTS